MDEPIPSVGEFGARFADFMEAMTQAAQRGESTLLARIREHVGVDPAQLAVTGASFPATERANLQLALDAVVPERETLGISTPHMGSMALGLSELLAAARWFGRVEVGPVQYADVEIGDGRVVRCIRSAVLLARFDEASIALVVSSGEQPPFGHVQLRLEGIAADDDAVSRLIAALRTAMLEHNVFRGQVISLHQRDNGAASVVFHVLPTIERTAVILPDGTLERVERHALGIAENAARLSAAARHLKRGILLHGPPGTGKTLTVNYLLSAMRGRTTVLLTGRGLGLIEQALSIARDLAPATIVLEDVDLVAGERTLPFGTQGVLSELLNQLEGLSEDADLLFLLTTNRADLIEPALAARPGRVDLAVEIPLPDERGRRRLFELYAGDIALDADTEQRLAARSEGVTGAFIKELMRQATLRGALRGEGATPPDVEAVLDELLQDRAALTRRLLGQPADGAEAAPAAIPLPQMVRAFSATGLPVPPGVELPGEP